MRAVSLGRRPLMTQTMLNKTLAGALCAVAALAIAACGGDDESSTSTDAATGSQPNTQRYCELVAKLDQISSDLFSKLDDTSPSKADLAAAQLQILNENADLITQIEAAVPDEIRDDFILSEQSRPRARGGGRRHRAAEGRGGGEPAPAQVPGAELPAAGRRLISRRARPAGRGRPAAGCT